eukprot:gene18293-24753_t
MAFLFEHADDVYEFAYSFPFSYTALQYELSYIDFLDLQFYRRQQLASTPQGRRIESLVISCPMFRDPLGAPWYNVGLNAHGPYDGGWQYNSCVSGSKLYPSLAPPISSKSSHPDAVLLRSHLTWVVVPMLNPDGTFLGNYRCDSNGVDLNRCWRSPSPTGKPALCHVLKTLEAYDSSPMFQPALRHVLKTLEAYDSSPMFQENPPCVMSSREAHDSSPMFQVCRLFND